MGWIKTVLMLFVVMFIASCDTPDQCKFKAIKMGVDMKIKK